MIHSIIGIDCATQPEKMGLARAMRAASGYRVTELTVGDRDRHPVEIVLDWIGTEHSALLALDAPLGWPASLGRELARHSAGHPIMVPGELLFRRLTDRVVTERIGKMPLEVGADRIARTAHAALLFLDHVAKGLREAIPLAWATPFHSRVAAIEVYPAATLIARGGSVRGYKKAEAYEERARLADVLSASCDCDAVRDVAIGSEHCLDALACVVAGIDFIEGQCVAPQQQDVAEREGWIWFREPTAPTEFSRACV